MNLNGRKEISFLIYGNLKDIKSSSRCQQKIMLEYLFKTDLKERALHSTKCLRETSPLSTDQVKAHLTHKIWQDPTTCQNGYSLNQIYSTTEVILSYLLVSLFDCGRHTGMINLKIPFSPTVLLVWLPALMYFGLNPIPNCFWVETWFIQ